MAKLVEVLRPKAWGYENSRNSGFFYKSSLDLGPEPAIRFVEDLVDRFPEQPLFDVFGCSPVNLPL